MALLLNDAQHIGAGGLTISVTGLIPGAYRVFTYAVEPQGNLWSTMITVPGSIQGTIAVTGPMPGNHLIDGVTHSVHDLQFGGGTLTIFAAEHWPRSYVNGLQILAVPEPFPVSVFAIGLAAVTLRRKRM
jgi:hypothetical protein